MILAVQRLAVRLQMKTSLGGEGINGIIKPSPQITTPAFSRDEIRVYMVRDFKRQQSGQPRDHPEHILGFHPVIAVADLERKPRHGFVNAHTLKNIQDLYHPVYIAAGITPGIKKINTETHGDIMFFHEFPDLTRCPRRDHISRIPAVRDKQQGKIRKITHKSRDHISRVRVEQRIVIIKDIAVKMQRQSCPSRDILQIRPTGPGCLQYLDDTVKRHDTHRPSPFETAMPVAVRTSRGDLEYFQMFKNIPYRSGFSRQRNKIFGMRIGCRRE